MQDGRKADGGRHIAPLEEPESLATPPSDLRSSAVPNRRCHGACLSSPRLRTPEPSLSGLAGRSRYNCFLTCLMRFLPFSAPSWRLQPLPETQAKGCPIRSAQMVASGRWLRTRPLPTRGGALAFPGSVVILQGGVGAKVQRRLHSWYDAKTSDDDLEGNSAKPGGPLTSKPMWPNTSVCSSASAFSCGVSFADQGAPRRAIGGQAPIRNGATDCPNGRSVGAGENRAPASVGRGGFGR